ncbi:MAG: TIGR01212 family radical SAM protein [Spirochaetales bacterium]|nr:TIGR01212 family radical SAM protein [Spirochaetales bacterium]
MGLPYRSYSSDNLSRYGHRVFRVGIDAGFTCPNRCRSKDGSGCIYCDSQGARAAYLRTQESSYRHDSEFVDCIDLLSVIPPQNQGNDEKNLLIINKQDIVNQIERGTEFIGRRYRTDHFAAYLQSFSNTFAPCEKLKELYDFIVSVRRWEGLIISTRPDCIDESKLDLIASYRETCGEVCIELGLQSGNDEILKRMNRGHDVACLLKASKAVKEHGIGLCLHVLTGFPGEGRAELDQTISVINQVHPDAVKIHNLNVAAGTRLYDEFLEGEVTTPCLTRHVENVIHILRRIPSDIVIERLMCETPNHRLASPRLFPDKNRFLRKLESTMVERGFVQGDLCQGL